MPRTPYFKNTNERMIALVIACAMFLESLDTTIVNTAIPVMARSLQVTPIDLKIALISYLISLAIFIPISGWVADKFGSKQVFISSIALFTLSSLLCGFSSTIAMLVSTRVLQGIGGSMMLPVGRLIILRTFGRKRLIIAMNKIVTIGILGSMLGPVLGGFIVSHFSWQWIFWVNVPIGVITVFITYQYFSPTKPIEVPPLDILGFILFGSGLAGLTFGFSALSETSVPQLDAFVIILMSILLLVCYFFHSRKRRYPIIKVELFKYRTFNVAVLGNFFGRLGFGGMPFLLPLLLQVGLSYPADLSGMLIAPIALGVVISKQFTTPILKYYGNKNVLIINTLVVGLSLWGCILIDYGTSIYTIAILTCAFGVLVSVQYSAMNSLAYMELPPEYLSAASSIMGTMQQLVQSFGVAASAVLLRYLTPVYDEKFELLPKTFHYTFAILGGATLLSVFVFIRLKPEDGKQAF